MFFEDSSGINPAFKLKNRRFYADFYELLTIHFSIYNIEKPFYFQKLQKKIDDHFINFNKCDVRYIWWKDKLDDEPFYLQNCYGSLSNKYVTYYKYCYKRYKKHEIIISNSIEDLEIIKYNLNHINFENIKVLMIHALELDFDNSAIEFNEYLTTRFPKLEILNLQVRYLDFGENGEEFTFENFPKTIKHFYIEIEDHDPSINTNLDIADTNLESITFIYGTFPNENIKLNDKIKRITIIDYLFDKDMYKQNFSNFKRIENHSNLVLFKD